MEIQMEYYLIVSAVMFFAGVYGFITRRNLIAVLISIELILNAVDINFAVFNRYLFPGQLEGFFFTIFAIAIARGRNRRRHRDHHQHLPQPA